MCLIRRVRIGAWPAHSQRLQSTIPTLLQAPGPTLCTLPTSHSRQPPRSPLSTLHSLPLPSQHFTLSTFHFTLYTLHFPLSMSHSIHTTLNTGTPRPTPYTAKLCRLCSALCAPHFHSTLTPYPKFPTPSVHFTLFTGHFAPRTHCYQYVPHEAVAEV